MDIIHVNVNDSDHPRALNRFTWGGEHIIPCMLPFMIKGIQPIIIPEKSPGRVTFPKYVHCQPI